MEQDRTFLRLEEDVHRLEEDDFFNGVVADAMDEAPFWRWAGPGRRSGRWR